MGGICVGHRRKRRQGRHFVGPMDALMLRVESNQDAPMVRKRQTADDRCRRRLIIAPAVDDQSAAREESDADSGARSASERNGVAFHINGPVVQVA